MGRSPRGRARPQGPGGLFFFCSLWLAGLAGLSGGFVFDHAYWSPVADRPAALPGPAQSARPTLGAGLAAPLAVLFMATDVDYELRDGKQVLGLRGNTDTMILARLDPSRGAVRLLSIPRDTRVPIPGHGVFKVNAANPYGGPELSKQVVATLLGVDVDRYLVINTQGVIQLVEALGGVNVYVPKAMSYDDHAGKLHIHLEKGWNHLDGRHAHDFLRFRHDDQGDIGRVQRQQAFIQALMAQYMNPVNLLKTPQLLLVARQNLATDMSAAELLRTAVWAKDLGRDKVAQAMVPGREAVINGGWYWEPNADGIQKLVKGFWLGTEEAQPPASYHVSVLDGVGDRVGAARLRAALVKAGYGSVELDGPAERMDRDHTEVIAQNADEAGARALAAILGTAQVTIATTGVLGSDFTVILGKDWARRAADAAASAPAAE